MTGSANATHIDTVTATASDDDSTPAVVSAKASAEVAILPVEVVPLLRPVVLFLAATILVGGLGVAVVRRTRV